MKNYHVAYLVVAELKRHNIGGTQLQYLPKLATGFDPLWRQSAAALSVGPTEFGQFMVEAAQSQRRFHDAVNIAMDNNIITIVMSNEQDKQDAENFMAPCPNVHFVCKKSEE
jgi:hypothetical protein